MRIRTIKPEFWTHEELGGLSDFSQLMAIALLNYSDDKGYFDANPKLIRGAVFPLRDDYRKITGAIRELCSIDYIEIVKTDPPPCRYIGKVKKFEEHQVISHAKDSRLKTYCDSSNVTVMLPEDYCQEWNGKEGKGTGKGTGNPEAARSARCVSEPSSEFLSFWDVYPRKEAMKPAWTAWQKLNPPIDVVLETLARAKKQPSWCRGKEYIPLPATWLNAERWDDEL